MGKLIFFPAAPPPDPDPPPAGPTEEEVDTVLPLDPAFKLPNPKVRDSRPFVVDPVVELILS